jgi:NAD-dependent DNA ligase
MSDLHVRFRNVGIDDRQVSEVIGIAHGIIADGGVNQAEAEYLHKWLDAREHVTGNPVIRPLNDRLRRILADGVLDADEAADLLITLTAFAGGDFEAGEITKATSLPLCNPAPTMVFSGSPICFTGTFAFGTRQACEAAVKAQGAAPGGLTAKTRYLVIGTYATDSWMHSAFGRKIEKAVEMPSEGKPIGIVGEAHWVEQMKAA